MLYVMLAEDYFIYAVREKIKNNGMVTALTIKILLYIYKNT